MNNGVIDAMKDGFKSFSQLTWGECPNDCTTATADNKIISPCRLLAIAPFFLSFFLSHTHCSSFFDYFFTPLTALTYGQKLGDGNWGGTVWTDWAIYCTLGHFLNPLAAINLPKSTTLLDNFCKGVQIYHFSSEIIFGQLFDIWRFFSGNTEGERRMKVANNKSRLNQKWLPFCNDRATLINNLYNATSSLLATTIIKALS